MKEIHVVPILTPKAKFPSEGKYFELVLYLFFRDTVCVYEDEWIYALLVNSFSKVYIINLYTIKYIQ